MISAVLIEYQRQKEISEIISHLKKIPQITEIIVHDNRLYNIFTYGRYKAAEKASNSIIYTQDDDCLISHINELISAFDGTQLVNTLRPKHSKEPQYQGAETLLGWGSLFKKEWISVFKKYVDKYGEDYLLFRGGDRIFTTLLGQTIKRKTIIKEIHSFPSATSNKVALYKRKDYFKTIQKIRERVQTLI